MYHFVKFMATKKGKATNLFFPFFCCIRDTRERDLGSTMENNHDPESGIPDLQHCFGGLYRKSTVSFYYSKKYQAPIPAAQVV